MKHLIWLIQLSLMISLLFRYERQLSPTWQLVFYDEFDGTSLDRSKWNSLPGWGRTDPKSEELQYYADDALEVEDGVLRIKAEKREMGGKQYTSGFIDTRDIFTQAYGYFEIRAKLPAGQGLWPAFWLLPYWIWPPEIDVFEFLGHDKDTIYMSHHWSDETDDHKYLTVAYSGEDFSDGFHTFAVEWNPGEVIWYVDGIERHRTDEGVPNAQMFLIANLAVGGEWPGNPDDSTPFPSYMEIDYIRVYTQAPFSGVQFMSFLPGIMHEPGPYPYPTP